MAASTYITIAIFGLFILAFSAVWSNVARVRGYDEASLAWFDLLVYAIAGFVAARFAGFLDGWVTGAVIAGIEATIGWLLHDLVWARRPRPPETSLKRLFTVVLVILLGGVFGGAGALLSKLLFT